MTRTEETKYTSLRGWITTCALCVPIVGLTSFYGLFHLALGIPLASLWEPYAVVSVLTLAFGPSMYWAVGSYRHLRDNRKRTISVAGSYLWSVVAACVHYGAQVGFLAPEDTIPMYVITTTGIALACLLACHIRRKIDA